MPDEDYKITDVVELLKSRFVTLTGGIARNGAPLVTFSDVQDVLDISNANYVKVITYLCGLVPKSMAKSGFMIVIDRRQNTWKSVKSVLLKISMFFPSHVQVVFLLQPHGYFQRAFADFRSKFVKEQLEFKVVFCDVTEDLAEYIELSQLPNDIGGNIVFDCKDWIENRSAVEKYSQICKCILENFTGTESRLQHRVYPSEVAELESIIERCLVERKHLLDDYHYSVTQGNTLLTCIKRDSAYTSPTSIYHVAEIESLLKQLETCKHLFDLFWTKHGRMMKQKLSVHQFVEDFILLQYGLNLRIEQLEENSSKSITSVAQVEQLYAEFDKIEEDSQKDLDQGERMCHRGDQMLMEDQYGVDSIRPKCLELQRMCERYKEMLRQRRTSLSKEHDLRNRLERANLWCSEALTLLANHSVDHTQTADEADDALNEINNHLEVCFSLKFNDPREFHNVFEEIMTPELRGQVQQVLKNMEYAQLMCSKRQEIMRKSIDPLRLNDRFVLRNKSKNESVTTNSDSLDSSTYNDLPIKHSKSADIFQEDGAKICDMPRLNKSVRLHPEGQLSRVLSTSTTASFNLDSSSSGVSSIANSISHCDTFDYFLHSSVNNKIPDVPASACSFSSMGENNFLSKRRQVMSELLDTEKIYVNELHEILTGYSEQIENRSMQHIVPRELIGRRRVIFGNLEQIYQFHSECFLQDLEECRDNPAKVGQCFIFRKKEFQMYNEYCQNRLKSEELQMSIGVTHPFFQECQRRLGHMLPLGAFLLKPVQRITKYQLMLKEMLRFVGDDLNLEQQLEDALSTMLDVLKFMNASMHQLNIIGYQFIQTGITDCFKGDKHRFELWSKGREQTFIFQCGTVELKDIWVKQMSQLLVSHYGYEKYGVHSHTSNNSDNSGRINELRSDVTDGVPFMHTNTIQTTDYAAFDQRKQLDNNDTASNTIGPDFSPLSPSFTSTGGICDVGDRSTNQPSLLVDQCLKENCFGSSSCIDTEKQTFVSKATYVAMANSEICLMEGQVVQVVEKGEDGWWYVHLLTSGAKGWVPSSYLRLETASR